MTADDPVREEIQEALSNASLHVGPPGTVAIFLEMRGGELAEDGYGLEKALPSIGAAHVLDAREDWEEWAAWFATQAEILRKAAAWVAAHPAGYHTDLEAFLGVEGTPCSTSDSPATPPT